MCAAALSQPVDWNQTRENEYLNRINYYDKSAQQLFPQMFAEIVEAFEQEGARDILGEIYMELEMYNKWHGQFFTPEHICRFMAKVVDSDLAGLIERQGYISACDPCCGGGALLIAFTHNCIEQKINYQRDVLFVGQDIDPVVARMCYIQMSLLGMPGYVAIGNSLTQPLTGHVLTPAANGNDIWYTPLYFHEIWHYRRLWLNVKSLMTSTEKNVKEVQESTNDTLDIENVEPIMLNELSDGQFQFSI